MFLSGEKDWGMFQLPGAMEKMKRRACSRMDDEDVVVIEGAGHWVQQEQPEMVVHHIRRFLHKVRVISSFYRVTDRRYLMPSFPDTLRSLAVLACPQRGV